MPESNNAVWNSTVRCGRASVARRLEAQRSSHRAPLAFRRFAWLPNRFIAEQFDQKLEQIRGGPPVARWADRNQHNPEICVPAAELALLHDGSIAGRKHRLTGCL